MSKHDLVYALLEQLRADSPLVHNITNYVAMDMSANALLAIGASPAMIHTKEEVRDFVSIASSLVVNIGTLSPPWVEAMQAAMQARPASVKAVLDPVGAGATPYRTEVAGQLAAKADIIRANASEVGALIKANVRPTKGVDATDSVQSMAQTAVVLAKESDSVVAMTGQEDFLTNGHDAYWIGGGSPLMTKVTAVGCALSATVGAFASLTSDLEGALAASVCFKAAGTVAASSSPGPGTFKPAFLDALANLNRDDLNSVKIKIADV